MNDPTAWVLLATFALAAGVLGLGWRLRRAAVAEAVPAQDPAGRSGLDMGYVRADWLGLALITAVYAWLTLHGVMARSGSDKPVVWRVDGLIFGMGFHLMMAGVALALVAGRMRLADWLGLRWPGWKALFWLVPLCLGMIWTLLLGMHRLGYLQWLETLGVETMQDSVRLLRETSDPTLLVLMVLMAVVVAPVCEELVFRGYLYPAARHFAGPLAGALASGLVFGAAHGALAPLPALFVFGCVLAWCYEKTRSLWAPVVVHVCFNAATVLSSLAYRAMDTAGKGGG